MEGTSAKLVWIYISISVLAFFICWSQNLHYVGSEENQGIFSFVRDLFVTPASRSVTWDIVFFTLAACIWMIRESKIHQIPFVWAYIIFGMLVAISVTFPLFLVARERAIHNEKILGQSVKES